MVPIVLHHGLFGSGEFQLGPVKFSYFRGIDRAIAARGHPVVMTNVHPTSSIETRARQLKEDVFKKLKGMGRQREKVILIAHSLGGLDARYAVSKLGMADHVACVVTVTTPHRGSPVADWIVKNVGERLRILQLMNVLGLDMRAIVDLTTRRCAEFNEEVPDVPGLNYFSVSAAQPPTDIAPFAFHSHQLIFDAEGENDGMVSVKSSTWGRHLGVWPADHWQTINRHYRWEIRKPEKDIVHHWTTLLDQVTEALSSPQLVESDSKRRSEPAPSVLP